MTASERTYMQRAVDRALQAEVKGNLPIGAVIVLENEIIAQGGSRIVEPQYHPGRHAEMEALGNVPLELWPRAAQMTCYTTLEPCVMCFGAMLLHGIGRIVYGAADPKGGASTILDHLPPYYAGGRGVPVWKGPIMPEICDALYERAKAGFDRLPCGHTSTAR